MPTAEIPEKLVLRAIDVDPDGDSQPAITVQFNPNVLNRAIQVSYQKREILGLSYQPHEYLSTENQVITFAVFYNAETQDQLKASQTAMRFLESLAYGPAAPGGILSAAPSRVLIVWPRTLSITARLTAVTFKHERWNKYGDTIQWSAACTFEASNISRITSDNVRAVKRDDTVPPVELF